jgi:hypothetical protein
MFVDDGHRASHELVEGPGVLDDPVARRDGRRFRAVKVTEPGTSYTTVFCDGSAYLTFSIGQQACWTTFNPGAPEGLPMTQGYKNCSQSSVAVLPASWQRSGGT